jgi:quinol monooxygenase YgiN
MSVGVLIEHQVRHGRRDDVRAVWEQMLRPAIEANDAHEAYSYMFDADDPDIIRAFQCYTDAESASAFLATPAYAEYLAAVEGLLVGPPRVLRTDMIWTKAAPQGHDRRTT